MKNLNKWSLEEWLIYFCAIGVMVMLLLFLVAMAGCTVITQQEGEENSSPHASVLPASVVCIMSACDAQFSDRTQRAGTTADATTGDIGATQTATAVPTVTIPLTGSVPTGSLKGVSSILEKNPSAVGAFIAEKTDPAQETTGEGTGTVEEETGEETAPEPDNAAG